MGEIHFFLDNDNEKPGSTGNSKHHLENSWRSSQRQDVLMTFALSQNIHATDKQIPMKSCWRLILIQVQKLIRPTFYKYITIKITCKNMETFLQNIKIFIHILLIPEWMHCIFIYNIIYDKQTFCLKIKFLAMFFNNKKMFSSNLVERENI